MSEYQAENVKNYRPVAGPRKAGEVMVSSGYYAVGTGLTADDLVSLAVLPPGCIPVDLVITSDDLEDSSATPAIVLNAGFLDDEDDPTDVENLLITSSSVAQSGGIARMDTAAGRKLTVSNTAERTLAVKVATAATTPKAGTIYADLYYRAAEWGY